MNEQDLSDAVTETVAGADKQVDRQDVVVYYPVLRILLLSQTTTFSTSLVATVSLAHGVICNNVEVLALKVVKICQSYCCKVVFHIFWDTV